MVELEAPLGQPAPVVAKYIVEQLRAGVERKASSPELLHDLHLVVERGWKRFVHHGVTEENRHAVAAEIQRLIKGA